MIKLYNEDCFETISRLNITKKPVDLILTSPPYNTGKYSTSQTARNNFDGKYDIYLDAKSTDEYCDWCAGLFNAFDTILKKNGVILWNVSYGANSKVNKDNNALVWLSVADIIRETNFTVADRIIWKKKFALPNNVSANKLTRIVEDVFVFCRKDEYNTYNANKEKTSVSKVGQQFYAPIYNFVEAKNNDGSCKLNKATFSSELVTKLLSIYVPRGTDILVYDPFMGTGTTAVGCVKYGVSCIGSELSEGQTEFAKQRLEELCIDT